MAWKYDVNTILPKNGATLFIDGQWREAANKTTFEVDNPSDGGYLFDVSDGNGEDAKSALDAASAAQEGWAESSPVERRDLLERAYEAVMDNKEKFAELMTREMGKSYKESLGEVNYGAGFLKWFAEEAMREYGRTFHLPDGRKGLVTHDPVGPCYLVTPWNFPLAMGTRKIGPALAAGDTMIVKPAGLTPLTTLALVEVLRQAGVPKGVVNVVTTVHSSEISDVLLADRRLRKISFTGSTPVGVKLMQQAAPNVLRTSMELGGNAPFLVFDDADIDKAVDGVMMAKFRNYGEACTSANRILVQESVADEFVAKLKERVDKMVVGDGMDEKTDIGPLVNAKAADRMEHIVNDAIEHGATLVSGGHRDPHGPCFFEPTVLDNVPRDAEVFVDEIFGPVLPISRFETDEEGMDAANDTVYGLAAYAYTTSLRRSEWVQKHDESGVLAINSGVLSDASVPFGGVKQSGVGREGGAEGIFEYMTTKYTLIIP
ncbi:NAD-dependent succinate-semialdehyde dehydrogenase [Bifidobacterium sp. ESL0732]|uniref:NAD-dependent succinate-semialdehyde dehydrogenase n=1 Tax=Bifidobacterium sp. ESL0732 TaxID=2983222 RepID=UPI0023F8463B|nr:NAD-dependent succinate-semialdehyde dehydrogenase [Bifidobacterium sp. ESL0732]WEV64316.1 NAD-dependent succinate-semialdehyde dehydrogenase [Bifidobacterium sp. ESL0732]